MHFSSASSLNIYALYVSVTIFRGLFSLIKKQNYDQLHNSTRHELFYILSSAALCKQIVKVTSRPRKMHAAKLKGF
jgi:hypothetical protein